MPIQTTIFCRCVYVCLTYFYNRIQTDIPNLFIRFIASFLESKYELVARSVLGVARSRSNSRKGGRQSWSDSGRIGGESPKSVVGGAARWTFLSPVPPQLSSVPFDGYQEGRGRIALG